MARRISRSTPTRDTVLTAFPPFVYVSFVIGLSVVGILLRLQIQDNTLPGDLLIAGTSRSLATADEYMPPEPRMVRAVKKLRQHPHFDPSWDELQRIEAEQTGRVMPPRTEAPLPEVHFLHQDQLAKEDANAGGSWLQKTKAFLSMDIKAIDTVEDAVYLAFKEDRMPNLRMTMDWLDFSVEHLRSWCDILEVLKRDIPFMRLTQKLEAYVIKGRSYPVKENPAFIDTLAVVGFQAYKGNDNVNQISKAHEVTKHLLAATIESLRRAGFGRTVIVGIEKEDEEMVAAALQFIYPNVRDRNEPAEEGVPSKLGHMEVAFVLGNSEYAKTPSTEQNVAKAALQGLQEAFRNEDSAWMGQHVSDNWRMVYFTGSDGILQTKPNTLPVLKQQVKEEGAVLIPHHLQAIPHQRDISGTKQKHLFLDGRDFKEVYELNALAMYPGICCDEHQGPDSKPGLTKYKDCGKPWYQCDFDEDLPKRNHFRLKHYSLILLTQGSQMTLLSASESGRKCFTPKKKLSNHRICTTPWSKKPEAE